MTRTRGTVELEVEQGLVCQRLLVDLKKDSKNLNEYLKLDEPVDRMSQLVSVVSMLKPTRGTGRTFQLSVSPTIRDWVARTVICPSVVASRRSRHAVPSARRDICPVDRQ